MHEWETKLQAKVTCNQITARVALKDIEPRLLKNLSFGRKLPSDITRLQTKRTTKHISLFHIPFVYRSRARLDASPVKAFRIKNIQ